MDTQMRSDIVKHLLTTCNQIREAMKILDGVSPDTGHKLEDTLNEVQDNAYKARSAWKDK